ncbi:MAG: hypothetical protein CYG59_05060 [Chloroflexi bacterium]|nr:MAG: hypothetical protein CYG59_05060 [Chloroflexota bacterium]
MQRHEKLMLIRDVPAAIIATLDAIMVTQGLMRLATRELAEDFTPLLTEEGGPTAFVLSEPKGDWTACFSSLTADDEWQLVEAIAVGLEQPTMYAVFSDATDTYAYRFFADGVLHEEYTPTGQEPIDGTVLSERLAAHGIPLELIDDRTLSFNEQHLLVGYGTERMRQAAADSDAAAKAIDDSADSASAVS